MKPPSGVTSMENSDKEKNLQGSSRGRPKKIIYDVIFEQKGNKMFMKLEINPDWFFRFACWCEKLGIEMETYIKKMLNNKVFSLFPPEE